MGAQGRRDDHQEHQGCAQQAHLIETLNVEHAIADFICRHEQQHGRRCRHERAASPSEKAPVGQHACALVIVVCDFCHQCRAGDFIKGYQRTHDNRNTHDERK